jgi:hypothetical protein
MGWDDPREDWADIDHWEEMQVHLSGIKADRKRRVRNLAGKYIVVTKGRSSGNIVFYQDRNISSKGYWTQYLSNALGFTILADAKLHASGFRYGDPKVAIVTSEGIYQWV